MHDRPVTAAGQGQKRPQPIPAKVKDALRLMVYGKLDDDECKPLDFIAAAKECDIKPDQMRRYLDRPNVRAFLMAERRAFRAAICAGNEAALLDVRDNAKNGLARIGAVRALEGMEIADAEVHAPGRQQLPGLTVVLNVPGLPSSPQPPALDVMPDRTIPRPLSPATLDVRAASRPAHHD
ncbi:hypothetical protein [Bradyrhizobium sp. SZCCHNR1045]|uniref:hypothetical protein n=1 Tax=Bradyrhizobium sp. SZCCHNR1045 TaxID=3057353 RepID=UPI002916D1AF|nr:hypothetical protein [Bradyrhizobium sp. SZCCHNR1045]